jgi:magnesium-transporting ATPase (P-type)
MLTGLTQQEASKRLQLYGSNKILPSKTYSPFLSFIGEFKSPLVLMLIGASFISFATGSFTSATLILIIVIISSAINFFVSHK